MKRNFQRLTALSAAALITMAMTPALADAPAAPQNVVINYGASPASSADDTVSFDAVDGAASYKVYVYQDGDTEGKVTESTDTTIALAAPLDAGDYLVSVAAVNAAGERSKGSDPVAFTVEEEVKIPLGQVSDIAMDFSQVDADNAVYPTISFTPVENAGRYLVDVYAADKDGNKQLTSLGYTTRFTVPAAQAGGYMMDSTNYAALVPGYYVVAVTAYSNNSAYANGEAVEAFIPWINVEAIQPVVAVEEPDNGGMNIALENYENYTPGISVEAQVFADAACTELVASKSLTYTTSTSFGNTTHNNNVGIEVKDGEGNVVTGKEYYVVLTFDPEIYTGKIASEPVAFTCNRAGDGSKSTGSGGGSGGGMGGGATITADKVEITFTAEEGPAVPITFMGNQSTLTPAVADAADGAAYSYTLSGVGGMGEAVTGTADLLADGTAKLHVDGFGPFSDANVEGTWSEDAGTITLNWN